jgi:hypothetical protein
MSILRPVTRSLPAPPSPPPPSTSLGWVVLEQAPLPIKPHDPTATLPRLLPADEASFGINSPPQTLSKTVVSVSSRWKQALKGGWTELRQGIVPNAVVTAVLVTGSAVASTLPVLASAVVPVLLAPGFFLVCCVSDAVRGMAFGAFPKLNPSHWLKQLGQRLFKQ